LFTWTASGSSAFVNGFSNNPTPTTSLNDTLFNTGYDVEWVTYQVTPSSNGCNGNIWTYTVTVYPVPDLSNSPLAKEICNNNNTDIDLTSNVTGTLFTWTATGSSANITGYSDNAIPSTHIGDNLINLGDSNETVTYHIIPHANGCDGILVDFVVTVVPSPYLTNNPLDSSICNGQSTGLTLTSNVAGTLFTWTTTGSSGFIAGYSNSLAPGTLIDQTLLNSGFNNETVTYHITPENSGCPGSLTDYTVTVFPVPDVFFVPNGETVCEGQVSNLSLQSHVTGATFTWTATPSSPNLSGFADGSGDLIAQIIDNAGATIEWVTYQVTPEANGCPPGTTMPVILTVNPRPVVTAVPNGQSICNGQVTNLSLQADVTGSTFAWRAFASSASLTGFGSGSGPVIAQPLTNAGYTIDSVTYRVAATANGCTGDSTDFIVVVYPVADVIITPNGQTLCSGQVTDLTLQSNVAGTTFSWTATGSSPFVYNYSDGSGILIQQTLYNSGYMIPTVTYLVTPTANGCTGTQNSAVVTVNPLPVVSFTVCFDTLTTTQAQPFTLKGGNPPGGTFAGTGVNSGRFFPAIADTGRHTITYYYINTYGCDSIDSIHITVVEPALFSCDDTFTDIRDNRTYPTVQIGPQCWMAANLNYGIIIPSSLVQRDNCVPEKYCINDNPANCTNYGGLYQWNEIMCYTTDLGAQGFCPPGWHIPSETDWNTLFNFYISNGFAGSALKSSGYSGFNALMSGIRFHNSVWKFRVSDAILNSTMFWSSTSRGDDKAWAHGMNEVVADIEYTPSVSFYPSRQINAFLGRCLKD
ncbi:MAG: PKD-like domain-containing protein, partial [Bacteroidota bacterium]